MYKNRKNFGYKDSRKFGQSKNRFSGKRRGPGRGAFSQNINISKFIKKAEPAEKIEQYVPVHLFKNFIIDNRLKVNIEKKGYALPTPIQDKIIPHVLTGADVVGIANTGTGKTGAFLIPLIEKVILNPQEKILIIVPTRELAIQIDDELRSFVRGLRIFSACCVGGAYIGKQISALRYNNNFIIGTPGRLKDLMERRFLNLSGFNTVVLDEADRMLDMGFINDVRFMVSEMPAKRHTLFFAATMSREIEDLIREFSHEPVTVSVKTGDTAQNVDQDIVKIAGANKIDILDDILSNNEFCKVLIFGRTKHGVEKLSRILADRGHKTESIHGNKTQSQRERALGRFKQDQITILVATDVAARGLDIPNVSHVINFDVPATYDDYVHRIGRTGRGNKKGKAITFVD